MNIYCVHDINAEEYFIHADSYEILEDTIVFKTTLEKTVAIFFRDKVVGITL